MTPATNSSDYRGLARRQPVLALCFAVLLLGQAGIPFTTGFLAKFEVVGSVVAVHSYVLAVVAMASAAIAAFFYLRVAVTMFSPVGMVGDLGPGDSPDSAPDTAPDGEPTDGYGGLEGDGSDGAVSTLQVLTDAPPAAEVVERGVVPVPGLTTVVIGVTVAFSVVFGVIPGPILDFAHQATLLLFG